jgi:hypothetical protein
MISAVSSWVAAAISVAAFVAGIIRAWWNRPEVDWTLTGHMGWPNKSNPAAAWLEGGGVVSNFGDGAAHRVSVHLQRGNSDSDVVGTTPLLKPGDKLEFAFGVRAEDWDTSHLWMTWTPPPIRRRRELTSRRFPIHKYLDHRTGPPH